MPIFGQTFFGHNTAIFGPIGLKIQAMIHSLDFQASIFFEFFYRSLNTIDELDLGKIHVFLYL